MSLPSSQAAQQGGNTQSPEIVENKQTDNLPKAQGCGLIALLIFVIVMILGISAVGILSSWLIEQGMFEGSISVPDARWLLGLGYAVLIAVPTWIIFWLVKSPRSKLIYRTWGLAAVFGVVTVPARVMNISDAQTIGLLQILGMSLYIFLLFKWITNKVSGEFWPGVKDIFRGGWSSLLAGAVLLLPWVLWGAVGSPIDLLLNIVTAILFGVSASLTLYSGLLRSTQAQERDYRTSDLLIDSLVSFITLIIMVVGVGQTGTQLTLLIAVPLLALSLVALSVFGRNAHNRVLNWGASAVLIAIAASGPLIFIDPDEMMLVISSSPGELLDWVIRACGQTLLAILAVDSISFLFWRRTLDARGFYWVGKLIVAALWIGLGVVYFLWGQTGFYGERLFVILKDQVNVQDSANIQDIDQRRTDVYERLVQHAESTQASLRTELTRKNIEFKPYYLVNAIEVNGGPLLREWLVNRPEVDRVLDSPYLRPLPKEIPISEGVAGPPSAVDWNLTMINADQVWKELYVRGEGVVIGQSDSGVQGDHPELADSYLGRDGSSDFHWYDPWFNSTTPVDIGGHGTHTLGTVLGNQVGVAPDADWIGCVNLARNLGNPAYYLDCWQFMLAPFPQDGNAFTDGEPTMGADILNNSWGCPPVEGCDPEVYLSAVKALRNAGVFVVVSAGNSGSRGCGSVDSPPAIYADVYSVGAVNQLGNLADFSSIGPVLVDGSQRIKPDIVAPGEGILSAFPGSTYQIASGTSMAGPHVVGVVALMWSANPRLVGDIESTERILNETTRAYVGQYPSCVDGSIYPNNAVGFGLVDAYSAVKKALESK